MPGVTRVYVYRFTPPSDALTLAASIMQAGQHLVKFNKNVVKVDTVMDGEDMLLRLTVTGRDQWWLKKQVIYPVVGILTKHGIKIKDVKLDKVDVPHEARHRRGPDYVKKVAPAKEKDPWAENPGAML